MPTAAVSRTAIADSMTLVYDQTLSADAASFDVQNIPQGYKHLFVVANLRTTEAVAQSTVRLKINNDAGANYDHQTAGGTNTSTSISANAGGNDLGYIIPGASAASGVFGPILFFIPDYAGVVGEKDFIEIGGFADESAANSFAATKIGHWRNTVAINRITLAAGSGNLLSGSRLTIYGMAGQPPATIVGSDGWTSDSDPWTYASATTFTVAGDQTAVFSKGTRIRLNQAGYKYFVVTGSSHSAGTTTVTVTGGSDYSLANAAITDAFFSYQANPSGYPNWFNYSPTYVGFSADPAGGFSRFNIIGNRFTYKHSRNDGTSNATSFNLTVPVTPINNQAGFGGMYWPCRFKNNGTGSTTPGMVEVVDADAHIYLYRDWGGSTWTASAAKNAIFTVEFEF